MAFNKKFELKLYVPITWEVAGDMALRWKENLKNAAPYMFDRIQAKIPDDGTFINEMVTPANKAYRGLLNPSFISKSGRSADGIGNAQGKNMGNKFSKWLKGLQDSFGEVNGVPAKAFKDKIDASIDNWANAVADKTIRLTGDKIRGRGVTPITALYLVGDTRATSWTKQGDLSDGAPYNITLDTERTAVKAAVQQRLLQGGMMVINSEYQPSAIDEQNALNAALLTKLREATRCDVFVDTPAVDKCYCAWEMEGNFLILHTQVGLTTL
ncbi:MAG: hypothetical protein V1871_00775 [Planctomycetota bacterium]